MTTYKCPHCLGGTIEPRPGFIICDGDKHCGFSGGPDEFEHVELSFTDTHYNKAVVDMVTCGFEPPFDWGPRPDRPRTKSTYNPLKIKVELITPDGQSSRYVEPTSISRKGDGTIIVTLKACSL